MQTPVNSDIVESSERDRRTRPPWLASVRFALAVVVLGALLVSQLDAAHAQPIPPCSQVGVSSIRPDISPPVPNLGKFCGTYPLQPPVPAEPTESGPSWLSLPGLAELWAIVLDLLPNLAVVTAPPAAR